MATCELITIVGAGDVVAKRLLPAIAASQLASKVRIIHDGICDIDATDNEIVAVVDLSSMGAGAADWVSRYLQSNEHPVIVATPPSARSFYLHAALQGRGLVVAEKPLYINEAQRDEFPVSDVDLRRIFALSYYTQEKAIAWSWLQNPTDFQQRLLVFQDGRQPDEVREMFVGLGQLETVEIAICEGVAHPSHAKRQFWFEATPGGVWFDMGVHVFCLLFALSSNVSLSGVTGNKELRQFSVEGSIGNGIPFKCEFGKDFHGQVERRFLAATYSNGKVICDIDSCSCTIDHKTLGRTTIASRYGSTRYRTLIEQVREFILSGGWSRSEDRRDTLKWQRQALDLLIGSWPISLLSWGREP